jgi:hypothetical protein
VTHDLLSEALATLGRTPSTLAHLVAEADDARLDDLDREGWSARLWLAWFRDEEVLALRPGLERMLGETEPVLHVLERGSWLAERHRSRDRKEHLLADFALHRQASLAIVRALEPRQLERRGLWLGERVTVQEFVERWARHDRARIGRLEAAVGETLEEVLERRRRMVEEG